MEESAGLPPRGERLPPWGSPATRTRCHRLLRRLGWRIEGALPDVPKCVLIGAPHTSNWDFVLTMLIIPALGVRIHWIGKHTIFRPPFGGLLRRLGGIPVDRNRSQGVVSQLADAFRQRERLVVAIAPEGTRQKVDRWKLGFYHIALLAEVPIVPASLDYRRKVLAIHPPYTPTGDPAADLRAIRAHYDGVVGRHPHLFHHDAAA